MNYPGTLQRSLGSDKYVVFNFGAGGRTLLKSSPPALYANKSFWNSSQFTKAQAVAPHVVLIMLGTNDATKSIWDELAQQYTLNYAELIGVFEQLPSSPAVQLMTSTPMYNGNFAGINQTVVNHGMALGGWTKLERPKHVVEGFISPGKQRACGPATCLARLHTVTLSYCCP
jgi:hypothetical protein